MIKIVNGNECVKISRTKAIPIQGKMSFHSLSKHFLHYSQYLVWNPCVWEVLALSKEVNLYISCDFPVFTSAWRLFYELLSFKAAVGTAKLCEKMGASGAYETVVLPF
jgi:hypothetical protein